MVQRELKIHGLSESVDGNMHFDDADGGGESNSLLWTGEEGDIEEPLPHPKIDSSLTIDSTKFYAKFDLRLGYWQFPVHPKDRHELAFQNRRRSIIGGVAFKASVCMPVLLTSYICIGHTFFYIACVS